MLNLLTLGAAETSAVVLKTAKGAKLIGEDKQPVIITLFGPGSDQFEDASQARLDRQIERRRIRGDAPLTGAEIREDSAQFLADVTHSASANFSIEPDGRPLQTSEDFVKLYSHKPLGYIYEQLTRVLNDWSNFTPGSVTS